MVWYDVSAEFLIHLLARACNLCVHTKSQGRTKGRRVVDQFSPSPPLIRNLIIISSVRLHITESDSNFLFPAEKVNFCNQLPVRVDMNRLTTFNFEWLGIGDLSKWVLLTWYWSRSYASMCPSLMAQPSDLSEKKPFRQQNVVQRRGDSNTDAMVRHCYWGTVNKWNRLLLSLWYSTLPNLLSEPKCFIIKIISCILVAVRMRERTLLSSNFIVKSVTINKLCIMGYSFMKWYIASLLDKPILFQEWVRYFNRMSP